MQNLKKIHDIDFHGVADLIKFHPFARRLMRRKQVIHRLCVGPVGFVVSGPTGGTGYIDTHVALGAHQLGLMLGYIALFQS